MTAAREGELGDGDAAAGADDRRGPATRWPEAARSPTPLVPALDEILPVAAAACSPPRAKILELIPDGERLPDRRRAAWSDEGRRAGATLRATAPRASPRRVKRELIPAIDNFGETIDALDKYKGGIAQTADLWSGAFSTDRNVGPYTQIWFGNGEITPEGLGLARLGRARHGRPTRDSH